MAADGRKRTTRRYRPRVEALEALRLLDAGLAAALLPTAIEFRSYDPPAITEVPAPPHDAWDQVLGSSGVAELLDRPTTPVAPISESLVRDGLGQLDRYLGTAWARAGIPPQQFEDCTQAVYVSLLEQHGPTRFEALAAGVGMHGVREVLSAETPEGPDFFRAVDMVKKRAQRIRPVQPLDDHLDHLADPRNGGSDTAPWLELLHEVMDKTLSPREASLIRLTLEGYSPSDIAHDWSVTSKTVSNEKSVALRKLRDVLLTESMN